MSSALRFLVIVRTLAKYRLYDLLPGRGRAKAKLLLLPFRLFVSSEPKRGVRLRKALEELGPIFVKFGQILSTRPDLLDPDLIEELVKLQDKVPPFDDDEFKRIVESALGHKIETVFENYQHEVLASASIAQVHAAELKSGEQVVIKVVRPNIRNTIDKDTRLLRLIARWIEKLLKEGKRLRPVEVVDDYRNTIFDELDLTKEGANASQLRRNFENSKMLYIPKIYWEHSRRNVLVMERISGIPVNETEQIRAQGTNMKLLAERGVEIFFTQVFEHNFFHADMHPGNVFVSRKNPESPSYIGIDTAIVGSLNKEDQYYLARNMIAMFRRDYRLVAELHVQSGWVPEGTSIGAFESAIRSVCEPIFQKPLKDISFGEALISLFRTAQRFNMPVQPQLVLLQKTLLNIEGLGRQLYPDLDLWQTAHPFLERWLKQRYGIKNLLKEFKYHAPDWLERLPELPSLGVDVLDELKQLSGAISELKNTEKEAKKRNNEGKKKKVRALALALLAAGSAAFLPSDFILTKTEMTYILGLAALFSAVL